jgi:hypothetical protein
MLALELPAGEELAPGLSGALESVARSAGATRAVIVYVDDAGEAAAKALGA